VVDEHLVSLDLSGKVAIVTGAGRLQGIGAAICLALARLGADVLFTHWPEYDRVHGISEDVTGAEVLATRMRAMGVNVHALEVDLSQSGAAAAVMDAASESLGAPSILVNNAAHSTLDDYQSLSEASLDAHYAVNVRTMAMLSVEFARRFEGGAGGRIINLSSGQGVTPMPGELAYAATKGAVEAFTFSLASGVAERGITVNAIDPGATDTGWITDDLKRQILPRMAFGRIGEPRDTARLVVFLASDAGQWITGQIIHSRGA
jgi:3-oxoacyl-[acyl-carrier protein] reductase